ncbi:MAG: carboxypeptidase-like regulatory domain-containing protein [bacterium]
MKRGCQLILLLLTLASLREARAQSPGQTVVPLSKQPPLQRKITLRLNSVSLRQALAAIAHQTGIKFVYRDDLLDSQGNIDLQAEERPIADILEQLLQDSKIGFVAISLEQIVLTEKKLLRRKYGSVRGKVVDATTGEPLLNANVEVVDTRLGAASDLGGYFRLRLPAGQHDLRVSVIGYQAEMRHNVKVAAGKTRYLTFRLKPAVVRLPEVQVTSSRSQLPQQLQVESSVLTVRRSRLTAVPTVGEPDLFRTLQTLPGVSAPSDVSNELFIRGGSSDQNLILLDGAVVYNPYHLFGFAGAFNPDLVEQVNLSLGGFSARYGDRLSSVIDIQTKSISPSGISGYGNFSLMSSKVTLLGRLHPKIHWVMSARRTYHDLAAGLFFNQDVPYYFYDLYGKLTIQPNASNLLFVSGFFSRDIFLDKRQSRRADIDDPTYYPNESAIPKDTGYTKHLKNQFIWDNLIFSAHWIHEFSAKLRFELQASQSRNPTNIGSDNYFEAAANASLATQEYVRVSNQRSNFSSDFRTNNRIVDRTIRGHWFLKAFAKHQMRLGGGYSNIRLNYRWEELFNEFNVSELQIFFDQAPDNFQFARKLGQYYVYAEDLWQPNRHLSIRPGLRFEKRSFVKGWAIEPRLNLSYQLQSNAILKAAYGHFHQGLATSLEEGFLQLLPLPFPTERGLLLESADHFILGLQLKRKSWEFKAETYYKHLNHLIKATGGQPEFEQGTGKAYGVELGVKKFGDRLNLEVNYTLSYAKRHFNQLDYFTSFDQRHNLSAFGRYHLGKNWAFNFRWVVATGRPFTSADIEHSLRFFDPLTGEWIPFGEYPTSSSADLRAVKNRVRYPIYHRLDISFVKRIQKRGWALLPYIQVVNVYFRRNVFWYDFSIGNDQTYKRKVIPMMPIVPTFGVSLEF